MNIYQENILDNYHHPQNSTKPTAYTHSFKLQNLSCGDEIEIFLTIKDNVVESVNYVAEGCAISIASASILSESLKGKTVAEIDSMKPADVMQALGIELTASRINCAYLPVQAIKKAIASAA